ncbi:MAG: type II secretion system F family protein [Pirellulales bacterium]|nr:type II secretion system F family protein [Pirellulales bacterium]
MSPLLTLIDPTSAVVFAMAAVTFFLIARICTRRPNRQAARLDPTRPAALPEADEGLFGSWTPALAAQIPESSKEHRDFRLLLRQAGLYRPSARTTIYALRFVLLLMPLVAAGIGAVIADSQRTWQILVLGGLAAGVLSIVPRLYVFFRRRRRMRQICQGLPDTIDMLSMCASGGLGLSESLDHVAGQMSAYPELAGELRILKRQAEVGSLKQALADFSVRVNLPEARQLASLLTRGTRLGTQLSGSLNEQADHLRVARRQSATTQANKTPVKLVFPILFCFAPAALILLTAPAVLELRDFLRPPAQTADASEGFGTGAVLDSLRTLDQRVDPVLIGPAADAPR